MRHVYTGGRKHHLAGRTESKVVQLKCFEETINWHAHQTTDWSAESATKGVMDAGGCMNMLHKDHIYVVQGYMTYTCPIILNNIYMLLKTYICC